MRNKKLCLVSSFILALSIGLFWSFTSAVTFKINFSGVTTRPEYMKLNMVPVHFTDNGNDFGWFIYFANGLSDTSDVDDTTDVYYKVTAYGWGNGEKDAFECMQKVKWFYYNAERWERLWPLGDNMTGVTVMGWLYTRCRKAWYVDALLWCGELPSEEEREECESKKRDEYVDSHGYYGMVTHKTAWWDFVLSAWTNYVVNNWVEVSKGTELAPTLIRFYNKYPVWVIYDANWWAWFVWCNIIGSATVKNLIWEFNAKWDWNKLFSLTDWGIQYEGVTSLDCTNKWSAMDSLISVIVDGLVWINRDTENIGIQDNQRNTKMQYFSSVNVNNIQLINYARQKAEILCRWKWNNTNSHDSIQCVSDNTDVLVPDKGKTYIVRNGNVQVNAMSGNLNDNGYYDIFIDGGNLLINPADTQLKVFKTNWFISDNSVEDFSRAVNEKWSIPWWVYTGDDVVAWKFIKWNFIVNGNIRPASWTWLADVYFVYGKITSKDSVQALEKVFQWKCPSHTTGSNGTPCPGSTEDWINPYQNASLVIIDQNYPSPLYQ